MNTPIREPAVAGRFFPGDERGCRKEVRSLSPDDMALTPGAKRVCGGIVPHAGWLFSGRVAAEVLRAISLSAEPRTYVVFGAMHRTWGVRTLLYPRGAWSTPLGTIDVDEELASAVAGACLQVAEDEAAHRDEHSIEVQLPFIQEYSPGARFVPLLVPSTPEAVEVGRCIGEAVGRLGNVVFVGSSDLTHYGPRYGFTPQGTGEEALRWAKEVNDRRLIDLLREMDAEQTVERARKEMSACGAGALAATIAACRESGATQGRLLTHTTSAEVVRRIGGGLEDDAVGYAGVVFE